MGRPSRTRLAEARRHPERELRADRIRGLLLGALVGEALGSGTDGLTRDQVLRRYGRLVRIPPGAEPGAVTRALIEQYGAGVPTPTASPEAAREAVAPAVALALALGAGALAPPVAAADAPWPAATGPEPLAAASALMGLAAAQARRCSPFSPLRPAPLLAQALAFVTGDGRSDTSRLLQPALTSLTAQVRSPPAPRDAAAPYDGLPEPLPLAFLVLHTLLVRPRSLEEAVVYAVNLGGQAPARGALVGLLCGLQRGAAGIPRRWLDALPAVPAAARVATAAAEALESGERAAGGESAL